MTLFGRGMLLLACIMLTTLVVASTSCLAQKTKTVRTKATDFPELSFTPIAGASVFDRPFLVMGESAPVMGEGNGWAAPAFFDYDGDGKKDLIIGEFTSGIENGGQAVGNFMRVYTNEGTVTDPKFSNDFEYLRGYDELSSGTPLSAYNFCCMAFTPRIVDLNADSFPDIVTGQYHPGYITWFRGSDKGYLPGIPLDEEGDAINSKGELNYNLPSTDITGPNYWIYSAVAFLDADTDGDQDMITGGRALRLSENTGTKENPVFGARKLLLTPEGDTLHLFRTRPLPPADDFFLSPEAHAYSAVPYTVDWNGDGVVDLLVTDNYTQAGVAPITYFQGVITAAGLRFQQGVPLFTATDGGKEIPGTYTNLCVADWNNDGVNDLIIGARVPTLHGKFNAELAWNFGGPKGISKQNPGDYSRSERRYISRLMEDATKFQREHKLTDAQMRARPYETAQDIYRRFYIGKKYETLSYKGYIYVMLGKEQKY